MSALPQPDVATLSPPDICTMPISGWSLSRSKRVFDLILICAAAPILVPLLLIIAAAVRLSSPGPAIFRQTRVGARGMPFTILKFRTMVEPRPHDRADNLIGLASAATQRITPLGSILRKFKLDELPQFINVLRGDMSLVGPRPKIAELHAGAFLCRPGITGAATLAFAREESLLAQIPPKSIPQFYRDHIMPAKHELDSTYMAHATMSSDLRILTLTALGRWHAPRLPIHQTFNSLPQPDPDPLCSTDLA